MSWGGSRPKADQPAPPGASDDLIREEPKPRPSIFGLVLLLYFRPTAFFRHLHSFQGRSTAYFLALSYGVAGAIDRTIGMSGIGGGSALTETWGFFWAGAAIGGWIGSLFFYYIGEWWFSLRLRWSGEWNPDPQVVRKVYLCAAQVVAFPIIANALIGTFVYASPAAWSKAQGVASVVVSLIPPFWSLAVSYVGVRSIFQVWKWRARLWFVILPAVFYIAIIIYFAYLLVFIVTIGVPPDLDHPLEFSSKTMSFSYPGNWRIDKKEFPFDAEKSLWLVSQQGDVTGILLYESTLGPESAVKFASEKLSEAFPKTTDLPAFDAWGDWHGTGRAFEGKNAKKSAIVVRMFAAWVSERDVLEVREIFYVRSRKSAAAGCDLIRKTLKLTKK
jgi:hypothetical protein